MIQDYELPWRRVYESYAAASWLLCLIANLWIIKFTDMPVGPFYLASLISIGMFVYRLFQSDKIWFRKLNLMFRPISWVSSQQIVDIMDKTDHKLLYLGKGYNWDYRHTQIISDVKETPDELLVPPEWYFKWHNREVKHSVRDEKEMGNPLIHGLEINHQDILIPLKHTNSHTVIVGTTGSLKTRLYELLVTQAIHRKPKEAIIIIDPKGDKELVKRIRLECEKAGRSNDFHYFHPSFSRSSVRLNPVKNYNRPEEIANRIASLLPSESGSDPFVETAWRVVDAAVQSLLMIGITPTLQKISQMVETGMDGTLKKVLRKYFSDKKPDWLESYNDLEIKFDSRSHLDFDLQKLIERKCTLMK